MIVAELRRIQDKYGFLPRTALEQLAQRLAIPLYRINEIVSFFPHFRLERPPEFVVHVCRDMACALRGSAELKRRLEEQVANSSPGRLQICSTSCLGRCDRAPAVRCEINHETGQGEPDHRVFSWLARTNEETKQFVRQITNGNANQDVPDDRDLSFVPPRSDAWRIDIYHGQPMSQRYRSIARYTQNLSTASGEDQERRRILECLQIAGLLGMGGAGGRAFKKWSEVLSASGERKYVICNADESEPGTFKDRELLLRTPYLVLEAVILAGLFLQAERGFIYIRHEYEEQIRLMREEIAWAEQNGFCGENILGSSRSFGVEVFESPGGYICGEQTALVEAIENKRAEPRNRPPELQTNGLWNMPTLLNNVETLAWIPSITTVGGEWYASHARQGFKGARFFSVSGDVALPGVYEVPVGLTLRELIDDYCGGMRPGEQFKAVALSGPSGGFLPRFLPLAAVSAALKNKAEKDESFVDILELELDIAKFREYRLMLGAGIVVYGTNADILEQAAVCSEFYRQESCGKCVPCRLGSTKIAEIAAELQSQETHSKPLVDDSISKVGDLSTIMKETAICGLGNVAANPLDSYLKYFTQELKDGSAPNRSATQRIVTK